MKECRLITYTIGGNVLSENSLVSVRAAIMEGYKTGNHFHVVEPEGAPLRLFWTGRPNDVLRKYNNGSETEGKYTMEQINNMLTEVEQQINI